METTTQNTQPIKLFVGIDVHKRQWHVTVLSSHVHIKSFSQSPMPEVLKLFLDKHYPFAEVTCAYEACKFGFWIQRSLTGFGYKCLVVNPADIPTTNKESNHKSDPIDSRKIAKTLRAGLLRGIYVPSETTEGDRQLFRYRKRLWSDLVKVKNRIKDKLLFSGISLPEQFDNSFWTKAFISWLEQVEFSSSSTRLTMDLLLEQYQMLHDHFKKVSVQVRKLQREGRYKQDAKLLRGIPGIGPLTTVQLLTEVEDIERFPNFKHFNSFVGIKPTTHASGEHDWRGRMTYRQHKGLRSAIIESSWMAVRKDPALLARYEELLTRHTAKRAIIIIARKLLSRIYYVMKNKQAYEFGIVK
jgi:transposase